MITFGNKLEIEKFALITIHGLFTQINNNLISIDNAEHIFFTPYIMEELQLYNAKQEIIDLVHEGTELENFEAFNISIEKETRRLLNETERLLKEYKEVEFTVKC